MSEPSATSRKPNASLRVMLIAIPALILGLFLVSTERSNAVCKRCEAQRKTLSVGWGLYEQPTFLHSPLSRGCKHDWNDGVTGVPIE